MNILQIGANKGYDDLTELIKDKAIKADLWGGEHLFFPETKEYKITRDYGLFSNVCVSIYGIMEWHKRLNTTPQKITFNLTEYLSDNIDVYHHLFKTSDEHLELQDISEERLFKFYRYFEPNLLGIGRNKWHFDFDIINRLLKKYYTISDAVIENINRIEKNNNINYEDTVFIWARKTDKICETDLPVSKTYKDILEQKNLLNNQLILQTDDLNVLNDFENENIQFKTLNEIPYAEPNLGFHQRLSQRLTDDQFTLKYGFNIIEYLQRLIALMVVASKCKACVIYPGCLSTMIPMFRGNFENYYSFINDKQLFT